MNENATRCESCGMPIAQGQYCAYCVDASGALQPFEERFERMVAFLVAREPGTARQAAEAQIREHMRTMPAWKDHPALNR